MRRPGHWAGRGRRVDCVTYSPKRQPTGSDAGRILRVLPLYDDRRRGGTRIPSAEHQRPVYQRKPPHKPTAQFRPIRVQNSDDLLYRMASLRDADPPLHLDTNEHTRELLTTKSPTEDRSYTHREDLLDAALLRVDGPDVATYGLDRCQVLGEATAPGHVRATIIVPARPGRRR
jgi:hypothetical protein